MIFEYVSFSRRIKHAAKYVIIGPHSVRRKPLCGRVKSRVVNRVENPSEWIAQREKLRKQFDLLGDDVCRHCAYRAFAGIHSI